MIGEFNVPRDIFDLILQELAVGGPVGYSRWRICCKYNYNNIQHYLARVRDTHVLASTSSGFAMLAYTFIAGCRSTNLLTYLDNVESPLFLLETTRFLDYIADTPILNDDEHVLFRIPESASSFQALVSTSGIAHSILPEMMYYIREDELDYYIVMRWCSGFKIYLYYCPTSGKYYIDRSKNPELPKAELVGLLKSRYSWFPLLDYFGTEEQPAEPL